MTEERRVVYLISGPAHLPYLVTSLVALRKIWDGPVVVFAWPESLAFVEQIASDKALGIEVRPRTPDRSVTKNGQFFDKIKVMQTLSGGINLYLDADTIPVKAISIDRLFELGGEFGFCGTQFCGYVSNGKTVGGRIRRLLGREGIDQIYVEAALASGYPSVNGGVFSCRPESPALPLWQEWTSKVLDIFIADETVLHVVMVKMLSETKQFTVALGGSFNCSPCRKQRALRGSKVGIWHGHGDSFSRPNKSVRGVGLWWPRYKECLLRNTGRIAEWKDAALNSRRNRTARYIKNLEATPAGVCVFCGYGKPNYSLDHHFKQCPNKGAD